jgi:excisionase family DNA binding protein
VETTELLTYQQAANLLKVSKSTVVRWTRSEDGEPPILRAMKISRTVRIRRSDVEALLATADRPGAGDVAL